MPESRVVVAMTTSPAARVDEDAVRPAPPMMVSAWPSLARMTKVSSPPPPVTESVPMPPSRVSAPALPVRVSLPPRPSTPARSVTVVKPERSSTLLARCAAQRAAAAVEDLDAGDQGGAVQDQVGGPSIRSVSVPAPPAIVSPWASVPRTRMTSSPLPPSTLSVPVPPSSVSLPPMPAQRVVAAEAADRVVLRRRSACSPPRCRSGSASRCRHVPRRVIVAVLLTAGVDAVADPVGDCTISDWPAARSPNCAGSRVRTPAGAERGRRRSATRSTRSTVTGASDAERVAVGVARARRAG